jgi:hypothetical protein
MRGQILGGLDTARFGSKQALLEDLVSNQQTH